MAVKPPFVRSPYNYDTNKAGDESGIDTGTEGGAQQHFKDECDINTIIKRFGIGYEMPPNPRIPQHGDFTGVHDFHTAMNQVRAAQEAFAEMPAHIRSRFDNDPGKYIDFTSDPKNLEEMSSLGMLTKEAQERVRATQEARKVEEDAQAAARHQARQKPLGKDGGGAGQ